VAFFLFKKAADAGLPEAVAQLGQIYESGGYEDEKTGRFFPLVRRNQEKALQLFKKAAEKGNENAINFLGAYFFNVTKEVQRGVDCFRRAAKTENCARSLNNIAICFEKGYGDC
jgi:TPR repeat protein